MKILLCIIALCTTLLLAFIYADEINFFAYMKTTEGQVPTLGTQIKKGRKLKNISEENLANALGLTPTQYYNIENNKATPTRDIIEELEEKLQTDFVLY